MATVTIFGSPDLFAGFGAQTGGVIFGYSPDAGSVDIYPDPITIPPAIVQTLTTATSSSELLTGFVGTLQLSVTNGQVSLNSGAFSLGPVDIVSGDSFQLRGVSSATPGDAVEVLYSILSGSTVIYSGNFVIVSQQPTFDIIPTIPSLNSVTGDSAGQYLISVLFNVSGVSAGVDIPIITGDGVQVRVATTQGGSLGAPQSGTINVRLGYDVMVTGLSVEGTIKRYLSYGPHLLSFDISSPEISSNQYSVNPARIWKIGASGICQFPSGSEIMRGPNGGVRTIKDPDSTLDYGIDFSSNTNGDPIQSAQIIATGMTAVLKIQSNTFVGFNASGGALGSQGRVTVRITRQSGVIDDRSITFDFVQL